jgi:hypothetical protein
VDTEFKSQYHKKKKKGGREKEELKMDIDVLSEAPNDHIG